MFMKPDSAFRRETFASSADCASGADSRKVETPKEAGERIKYHAPIVRLVLIRSCWLSSLVVEATLQGDHLVQIRRRDHGRLRGKVAVRGFS